MALDVKIRGKTMPKWTYVLNRQEGTLSWSLLGRIYLALRYPWKELTRYDIEVDFPYVEPGEKWHGR